MGNKIARTTQGSATEYYLHELPTTYNLVLVEVVGRGRFLKSILCKHDEGLVLVKVYFMRGDLLPLKEYEKRLAEIRDIFQNVQQPHVWPFQVWLQTDKAAYLLRQYFFGNLHDRLSTRPFLSIIEKKWIAFQLLCAVEQSHCKGVCHGDIKCENVLVTSWNWLYLTDFASLKPTYIPDDDPSDFSFFFDTGGRRRCYLAPERFYEHGGEANIAPDAPLKPSMDIFSVGCVIAELFLEGQPLFELSQLLAYRRGQFDPRPILEKIQDTGIESMILHMIQLDPESRLSCASYLQNYASVIFPNYFSPFLHKFFSCLIPLDPDTRVALTQSAFLKLKEQMMIAKAATVPTGNITSDVTINSTAGQNNVIPGLEDVPSDHSQIVGDLNFLLKEVEHRTHQAFTNTPPAKRNTPQYRSSSSAKQHFSTELTGLHRETELIPQTRRILKTELNSLMSSYDTNSDTYDITFFHSTNFKTKCEGMVLIASLLCSCMRNVKQPQLRRAGLLLLRAASLYIDDEDRLQHVVPYVISMLSDSTAVVRCAALDTLCDVLSLVQDFPPSDAMIFPEYILPMLSMLPDDVEESVRICYASNIYKIAVTAYRFAIKSQGQLGLLRRSLSETVQELVMGPRQTPNVRRALLRDVAYLCYFFGHRQSNDFLLPILPAFLNDRDDQLRATFYEQLVYVCYFVGQRSVEEYLLPYIEPALSDEMEAVIVNVLDCLWMLCKSGLLRKTVLLGLIEKARPLLSYPIQWVRRSVVTFLAACSESLGPVDSFVYLSPLVRPFFTREPAKLSSETSLFVSLKPPVPKQVFYQVLEDARSSDMLERQRKIWYNSASFLNQWENIENDSKKFSEGPKARPPKQPSRDVKDLVSAGKMQFSGLVSPQMAGGNTSFCEVPSEGLPIYSVCIDKRAIGAASVGAGMAWLQPMNRPLGGLSSSVPPKLISSSLSSAIIKSSSNQEVRGKREAERDSDSSYITASKFQDISIHDIGIKGSSNISRGDDEGSHSDMVGTPSFIGWRPRGVLVAHLQEHRLAVNDVAVSNDQAFFVSASDDSTVRIWDTRKLEKDISFRSRLTYGLGGGGARALCAEMLRGSAQVVAGASDGTLHLFSVDYVSRGLGSVVERYSGIADVKKKDICEGSIVSLINCAASDSFSQTVMFSTRQCGIHIWDIRSNNDAWKFRLAPEEGYITSLVVGPCGNWFVSGSSRGALTLWDMRFLVPVNSWNYSAVCPVEKICMFVPQANSVTLSGGRPLVYVAAGLNEVSLWNAENGSCHQVLRTASMENEAEISNIPRAQARPAMKPGSRQDLRRNTSSKYRIEELNEPSPRFPGVRSLLPLPGGDVLTAGTDVRIRCWDHASPERSYCVCGPSAKGIGNDAVYDVRSSFGVQVVQETNKRQATSKLTQKALLAVAANDSAGCHQDAVLSLASVKLNQRLLISSSRDGAIKVWK